LPPAPPVAQKIRDDEVRFGSFTSKVAQVFVGVSAGPATRPAADLLNLSSTMTVQCSPLGCARRLKWEDGLRTVLGISETVLDEIPDRKPTGSIGSRLHQIANDVAAACASIVATLREVLDDRFWEESP
jgi:hypothetical protein